MLLPALAAAQSQASWPEPLGTETQNAPLFEPDVELDWRTRIGDQWGDVAQPNLLLWHDSLIVPADRGALALDVRTGQELWRAEWPAPPTMGMGLLDGELFAGASGGGVFFARSDNGSLLWQWRAPAQVLAPVAVGERVFVYSLNGRLSAIEKGVEAWAVDIEPNFRGEPIVIGGRVIVAPATSVYAFDNEYGQLSWSWNSTRGAVFSIAPEPGGVLVLMEQGAVLLAPDSGHVLWDSDVQLSGTRRAARADDRIVAAGLDWLYGLDRSTGALIWKVAVPMTSAPPVIYGGKAYVPSVDGTITRVNIADGRGKETLPSLGGWIPSPVIVLAEDRLIVGVGTGFVKGVRSFEVRSVRFETSEDKLIPLGPLSIISLLLTTASFSGLARSHNASRRS